MKKRHDIKEIQQLVINEIEKEAATVGSAQPNHLYQPIAYTLNMGGKRLRPVMLIMACDLFGGNIEKAMPAAIGVEVFHNFTLLHDDIMDHADIRRNSQTVHKKYSENVAILSGDAMSIMAYQYLLKTKHPNIQAVTQLFSQTAIEVCEGQQYDMDFENQLDVKIEDYLEMIRLKTAVLIAGSLKIGALLGNASKDDADRLYRFGINLGLAFQLQDDLLDVFADQNKFGKKTGGDIVANKKTFLLIKALELANPEQKEQLISWVNKTHFIPEEKIAMVKKIYIELGLPAINQKKMDEFYQSAFIELQSINIENARKEPLLQLAKTVMKREY